MKAQGWRISPSSRDGPSASSARSNTGPSLQASLQPRRVRTAHTPQSAIPPQGNGASTSACAAQDSRPAVPRTRGRSASRPRGTSRARKSAQARASGRASSGKISSSAGQGSVRRHAHPTAAVQRDRTAALDRPADQGPQAGSCSPQAGQRQPAGRLRQAEAVPQPAAQDEARPGQPGGRQPRPAGKAIRGVAGREKRLGQGRSRGPPRTRASRYCPGSGRISAGQAIRPATPPSSSQISKTSPPAWCIG